MAAPNTTRKKDSTCTLIKLPNGYTDSQWYICDKNNLSYAKRCAALDGLDGKVDKMVLRLI